MRFSAAACNDKLTLVSECVTLTASSVAAIARVIVDVGDDLVVDVGESTFSRYYKWRNVFSLRAHLPYHRVALSSSEDFDERSARPKCEVLWRQVERLVQLPHRI